MGSDARLHLRAAVWGRGDNRIAVLLAEAEPALPLDAGPAAALVSKGLALVTDLELVTLPKPPGWSVRLDVSGQVSVLWPHSRPLVDAARLDLPGVWRWAARRTGVVVLVAGAGPGLCTGPGAGARTGALTRLATAGALAGGALPFAEAA